MGGFSVKYKELLSVSIELPFYANRQSKNGAIAPVPDISITPDAETLELFKRMDLVLRATAAGIIILAQVHGQTDGGDDIMRFPAPKGSKITLLLSLSNRDVANLYDLPVTANTGQLLYLSNTVTDAVAARNDLHLTKAASGISGNSDAMAFAKANYRFHHTATVNPANASVKHLLTATNVPPRSVVNSATEADLLFDLSALPGGICELWIDGAKEDAFYHLADSGNPPVFGVIELSLDSALDTNYRPIEADRSLTAERPLYVVRFKSRKTIWRYTFHMQPNSPLFLEIGKLDQPEKDDFLTRLNIVTNDTGITFKADPSSTANDLVFVSTTGLALQESYHTASGVGHGALNLTLTKYIGDASLEAYVKRGLPYPSSALINATELPNIYSDIFITI